MRRKISRFFLVSIVILVVPLSGMSQKVKSGEEPGIIHNVRGAWGDKIPVKIKLLRTLGGLEEEDPNLAFGSPYDVVVDSAGNIYILDARNSRIQKISPEGKFLLSIGRAGQGPGDFQRIFSFDIDNEDHLFVPDIGNMRVQILGSDGSFLSAVRLPERAIVQVRRLRSRSFVKGGSFSLGTLMGRLERLPKLLEILNSDGQVEASFGEATDFGEALVNSTANNFQFEADAEDNIYVSFCYQNRVEKYSSDGTLLWRADRPLNYATKIIDKGRYGRDPKGNVGILAPQMNMVSMGIGIDLKGRVWINTWNRQMTKEEMGVSISVGGVVRKTDDPKIAKMDIHRLDIFGRDGILQGTIPLDHAAHGLRIFGDSLFVWERNNAIVYQYKIVEH